MLTGALLIACLFPVSPEGLEIISFAALAVRFAILAAVAVVAALAFCACLRV
jgi:hypothetical protein